MIFSSKKLFSSKKIKYIKDVIMTKNLIYIANNCYKNSSSTFAMEWILWEINSFEIFDLQGARLFLRILILEVGVLILEVGVSEYHGDSEIVREIHQD